MRQAPSLEKRRQSDFEKELLSRARAWIPKWSLADGERDFGRALLDVAARLSAEVAEHLDRGADKMARGFLDWLAVRGKAAQPARMPVVFKLADKAPGAVLAPAPARMQVGAQGASVVFETEQDVRLVPGQLELVVGTDVGADEFYLTPPGLASLDPLEPLPVQWKLKSFASAGTAKLQLDPPLGLAAGTLLEIGGGQYRIEKFENDIVTIEPALTADAGLDTAIRKVSAFAPFKGARNRQEHALYLGHPELLNLEAAATIDVVGAQKLADASWQYWGKVEKKVEGKEEIDWQKLDLVQTKDDALVLRKGKGSIEPRKVGEIQSRWIRARVDRVAGCEPSLTTDTLRLRINAPPSVPLGEPPAIEVFVNSTPGATSELFPLGREPKMFDALYLGCAEGFSKPDAKVDVQFDLAGTGFFAMSTLNTGFATFLSAVDQSGALHLFLVKPDGSLTPLPGRPPLRPPSGSGTGSSATADVKLASNIRPVMWVEGAGIFQSPVLNIAVASDHHVWVWQERLFSATASAWQDLESPLATNNPGEKVAGLAMIDNGAFTLVALRGMRLSMRTIQPAPWTLLPASNLDFKMIASIRRDPGAKPSDALVGIAADQKLYKVNPAGTTELLHGVALDVGPCALESSGNLFAIAAVSAVPAPNAQPAKLLAWTTGSTTASEVALDDGETISDTLLDVRLESGQPAVYGIARTGGADAILVTWFPYDANLKNLIFKPPGGAGAGIPTGAVSLDNQRVYVPGTQGEVFAVTFSGARLAFFAARDRFVSAFVTRPLTPPLVIGDTVASFNGTDYALAKIAGGPTLYAPAEYYWLDAWLDVDTIEGDCEVFATSGPARQGTRNGDLVLALDQNDSATQQDDVLLVFDGTAKLIFTVHALSSQRVATLTPAQPGNAVLPANNTVPYWTGKTLQGRILPGLLLAASNNGFDLAVLADHDLLFPDLRPQRQRATAVLLDVPANRALAVFANNWSALPQAGLIPFVVDTVTASWSSLIGDTSSNPDLSWEYWNGTGWGKLKVDSDTTQNLKHTGDVQFVVPPDLKPSDWAGKMNYWIRARLIGGDYGREKVVVTSTTAADGTTTQTVNRSPEGIQAPYALHVGVEYHLDTPVLPAYLVTEDSGTRRDQSDANRAAETHVEIFMPLCASLRRFEEKPDSAAIACPPDCDGKRAQAAPGPAAAKPSAGSAAAAPPTGSRAIYLGFKAELSGEPVNVLLLVDERPHEAMAPLKVAALVGDRFRPVVTEDKTRALGESGILSLAFPDKPTPSELFGKSLAWLRLTPGGGDANAWQPSLRGVYLNAAWARAAETLTRELVGSSEGMPNLRLQLARPPLLHDSLELRVKEPLGQEERDALLAKDSKSVLSSEANLPGDWVLWKQVADPGDCGPTERVYALDEESGILRFGDGLHGAIPPIGRDSIVAFRYQRTEPAVAGALDVPANSVPARAALGLVTPVQGVEAVLAADQAAGGAGPEPAERVLRFGAARLRHRSRAITARDFEDLALERLIDVVQARCFVRPGGVRLVVVMRGPQPAPSAAVRRELRRALLESAQGALAAPKALGIAGPSIRRLRVALRLHVSTLDHAGEVSGTVKTRIRSLFDSASGGAGSGWPLGADPSGDAIAAALLDVPKLESITLIELREVTSGGGEIPWRGAIRASELVMLAEDGLRIDFDPVGAAP